MKRILVSLLALLMMIACQPTPAQEYVVNKSDDVLEEKLHATPIPAAEDTVDAVPSEVSKPDAPQTNEVTAAPEQILRQTFPAYWNDTIAVTDTLSVTIDAPVITRADGVYPVYRSKAWGFTQAEFLTLLNTLLPKPVKRLSGAVTKEMVGAQIESFNEQAARWQQWRAKGSPEKERPDGEELTDEEIAIILDEYAEQLRLAPERDEEQQVSEYDPTPLRAVYGLEDGRTVTVVATDSTVAFSLGSGNIYTQAEHDRDLQFPSGAEYDVNGWLPVKQSRKAAEKTLWETLNKINVEGFAIVSAQGANMIRSNGRASETSGWLFELARDFGGYPLEPSAKADGRIKYAEGDGFEANAPIPKERIRIMVSEDGVVDFSYDSPKQIVRVVNENVQLLPFDEIRERAINGLRFAFAGYGLTWLDNPVLTAPKDPPPIVPQKE